MTRASIGFSLAVSGMKRPPAVLSLLGQTLGQNAIVKWTNLHVKPPWGRFLAFGYSSIRATHEKGRNPGPSSLRSSRGRNFPIKMNDLPLQCEGGRVMVPTRTHLQLAGHHSCALRRAPHFHCLFLDGLCAGGTLSDAIASRGSIVGTARPLGRSPRP